MIGAHYDHLGRGSPFSLAPGSRRRDPPGRRRQRLGHGRPARARRGRDAAPAPARRTLVFVAFGAEELGLLGSTHYVSHPAVPLDRTVAMVNLDMVGRLRDGRLHAMGVDTGQGLRALVEQAAQGLPASARPCAATASGRRTTRRSSTGSAPWCSSSRAPTPTTTARATPGTRSTPTGSAGHDLRLPGRRALADRRRSGPRSSACRAARRAPAPGRPATGRTSAPSPTSVSRPAPGVRLGGVRPGSPADRAGLQAGDVIVRFAGRDRADAGRSRLRAPGPPPGRRHRGDLRPRRRRARRPGRPGGATLTGGASAAPAARAEPGPRSPHACCASGLPARPPPCASTSAPGGPAPRPRAAPPLDPRERHLAGLRQLTFGGQNAEAYWDRTARGSSSSRRARRSAATRSSRWARTAATCAWCPPAAAARPARSSPPTAGASLYASTHHAQPGLPAPARPLARLRVAALRLRPLHVRRSTGAISGGSLASPGYDAEATIAPDGRIVFTSMRDGDLDLYVIGRRRRERAAAHGPARLRRRPVLLVGRPADRLARLAPDGSGASSPSTATLLGAGPGPSEPGRALRDGRRRHRGAPGHGQRGRELGALPPSRRRADRLLVEPPRARAGSTSRSTSSGGTARGLERLTYAESFASFPMFSPDGRRLVFCSSRGASAPREFNVFVADWVE